MFINKQLKRFFMPSWTDSDGGLSVCSGSPSECGDPPNRDSNGNSGGGSSGAGGGRDYPSGSGRGDHDGGGRGEHNSHENSHGTGGSGSSYETISDRARRNIRLNAEEESKKSKENFESNLESLSSYPHAHLFTSYDSFCSYALDNPAKTGGRFIISLPPEPIVAIEALGRTIGVRSLAPGIAPSKVGWGGNVLANVEELLLCHNRLTDSQLDPLIEPLHWQTFSLKKLDLSYNHLTSASMPKLMYAISNVPLPSKAMHNITILDLSNNNLDDSAAKVISDALAFGQLPATKYVNLSGNKGITNDGDTQLVQALKGVGQDIVIFTRTLDEIVKMTDGSREEKVAIFRNIIEKGKSIGTYDKAIVVDKSWLGKIKNVGDLIEVSKLQVFGFGKCHLLPDPKETVESYAQDKIIATLPTKTASGLNFAKKYVGKLLSFHDVITCFVSSREDALTSEIGQQVLAHELCLLGEEEFCGE